MNFLKKIYLRTRNIYSMQRKRSALKKITKTIFFNRRLIWNAKGYYVLTPMPDRAELDKYYERAYWMLRGDQKILLKDRDNDHWMTLEPFLNHLEPSSDGKRFLNIGAGHGGISHLFFARGYTVFNYEPGIRPSVFDGPRWVNVSNREGLVNQKFKLIYSSHSLEHVQDIDIHMQWLDSMLASGGLFFIEVPNCNQTNIPIPQNGGQDGKVIPPHTYYFTIDFFKNLPYDCLLLGTYSQRNTPNTLVAAEDGDVIRYLGCKQ